MSKLLADVSKYQISQPQLCHASQTTCAWSSSMISTHDWKALDDCVSLICPHDVIISTAFDRCSFWYRPLVEPSTENDRPNFVSFQDIFNCDTSLESHRHLCRIAISEKKQLWGLYKKGF